MFKLQFSEFSCPPSHSVKVVCLTLNICTISFNEFVQAPPDSHEAVFPLTLVQGVFNEAAQFEKELLL